MTFQFSWHSNSNVDAEYVKLIQKPLVSRNKDWKLLENEKKWLIFTITIKSTGICIQVPNFYTRKKLTRFASMSQMF